MKKQISLAHGDGGELAHKLIQDIFVKAFSHHEEAQFDAAKIPALNRDLAFTTDSFVIKPIFFPGGNIGKLAVAGTVNDLSVSGAIPKYLSTGYMIEEGFLIEDLKKIVTSMAEEAKKAGVKIVAGDTKVVERGSVDGVFINTTGIGVYEEGYSPQPDNIQAGDAIIVSGTIGDHGLSILSARGELGIHSQVKSDCASLTSMIQSTISAFPSVRVMRDPTRGGVATTIVEMCEDFQFDAVLSEEALPIREDVAGACEILGFDPLYMANEGKAIFIVAEEEKDKILAHLQKTEHGKDAKIIGKVIAKQNQGKLYLETPLGTKRRLNRLANIQLPRIC